MMISMVAQSGVLRLLLGIFVILLSSPTDYIGNLWVSIWWVQAVKNGKLHDLTRWNILRPHPPKPCHPRFCTLEKGPWLDEDEILARRNWEPVFSVSKTSRRDRPSKALWNTLENLFWEQRKQHPNSWNAKGNTFSDQPTIIIHYTLTKLPAPKTVAWLVGPKVQLKIWCWSLMSSSIKARFQTQRIYESPESARFRGW